MCGEEKRRHLDRLTAVSLCPYYLLSSVVEPHHFDAAPGKNFDVAPAPVAPVPTLLYSKTKFLKRT
jgi:hypothetical protein